MRPNDKAKDAKKSKQMICKVTITTYYRFNLNTYLIIDDEAAAFGEDSVKVGEGVGAEHADACLAEVGYAFEEG